jgi:RimJ/RimL family protein N-acetyltransferase
LNFHKLFTYAFDLRPHIYEVIENAGFLQEAVLQEHCFFNGVYKDVIMHAKFNKIDKTIV